MKKEEYLFSLKTSLQNTNETDKQKLIDYYKELIEDAIENGQDEERFISNLEPPELVAKNYIDENKNHANENTNLKIPSITDETYSESKNEKEHSSFVKMLLVIANIIFIFAGAVTIFSLIISLISLFARASFALISSFSLLIYNTKIGFAQIGYSLILYGFFILGIGLLPFIFKGYRYVINLLRVNKKDVEKPSLKSKKSIFIPFSITICSGLLVFIIAFATLDFNYKNLNGENDLILCEQIISDDEALVLKSDNMSIEIIPSETNDVTFSYYQFEDTPRNYSYDNGKISIDTKSRLKIVWKHGVFYNKISSKYNKAYLYLPADFDNKVTVSVDNGSLKVKNVTLDNLDLKSKNGSISLDKVISSNIDILSNNGSINVNNCTSNKITINNDNGRISINNTNCITEIYAKTSNGSVELSSIEAEIIKAFSENGKVEVRNSKSEYLTCETSNGLVSINSIVADNIQLSTQNGAIKGSIDGSKDDYRIDAHTSLGYCNLTNKYTGDKSLTAKTQNGAIQITFLK